MYRFSRVAGFPCNMLVRGSLTHSAGPAATEPQEVWSEWKSNSYVYSLTQYIWTLSHKYGYDCPIILMLLPSGFTLVHCGFVM